MKDDGPLERAIAGWLEAEDRGEVPDRGAFLAAHPEVALELDRWLDDQERVRALAAVADADGRRPDPENLPAGFALGPYRVELRLGGGGMGTVYRAEHVQLGRPVAIKVLPERLAADPQFVDRFRREARSLARLEHPNIVRVHDLAQEGELYYFVMEFVDGVDLRRLMETGDLTPERALALVPQVCQALEYAHERGIVHRDVKPENILVDRGGTPKIADFGLAKVLSGDSQPGFRTRTDVLLGTYHYMAPEQRRSAAVDHRADIYALGVVLYEMLTGDLPVGRFPPPSARPGVDRRLDDVVTRALENEPARRYQRASHLGRDVSAVLDAPRPAAPAPARPEALRVVSARDGEELARGAASWLVVACRPPRNAGALAPMMGTLTLRVLAWSKHEVSIQGAERDFLGRAASPEVRVHPAGSGPPGLPDAWRALPGLEVVVPAHNATVQVPRDLPLLVDARTVMAEVAGTRSALHLAPGRQRAEITDHGGPLHAERVEQGALRVVRLDSSDFHLRAQTGPVSVLDARVRSGGGTIEGQGAVWIGGAPERCAFAYDARSALGRVRVDLGEPAQAEPQRARGVVGGAGGLVEITTHAGDVRVCGARAIRRLHFRQEAGVLLGWAIVWILVGLGAALASEKPAFLLISIASALSFGIGAILVHRKHRGR